MELELFSGLEHYLKAQRRARRRRHKESYCDQHEFQKISEWWRANRLMLPESCLCHGAFRGVELKYLQEWFSPSLLVGTDLDPAGEIVLKHDFRHVVPDWVCMFDLIYSNSLDHADNPWSCLRVWMDQLSENGSLFLQWTTSHRHIQGGDCFGAELHEYIQLADSVGSQTEHRVVDLIYCGQCLIVLVVSK